MSRRDQLAGQLSDLSGPLGPVTSPGERAADITLFLAGVTPADVPVLVDLLFQIARTRDPTDMWSDQHELLAQEALTSASVEAPEAALAAMTGALGDPATRGAALDMIGALGRPSGVPVILGVLRLDPSEDDLVRAAAALGEIGGDAAVRALADVRAALPTSEQVADEVLAALEQIQRRAGS